MEQAQKADEWDKAVPQAKMGVTLLQPRLSKQQQADEVRRMDSLQEAHLIKAFQGHHFVPSTSASPDGMSPSNLQQRQEAWLEEQRTAPTPAQAPVLPEYHLQLPASAFEPLSATGSGVSTPTPMEEDPKASASPIAEPAQSEDQQTATTLTAPNPTMADSLAKRAFARSASSIKPRERREPDRYTSEFGTPKSAGSALSSRRASQGSSMASGYSDGVMMLLQACEALDGRRNLTPTSSYSPSRPPRPRSKLSDLERIRASFPRVQSDPFLDRHMASTSSSGISRREKENAAIISGPVIKKERAAPKPIKARRGRSELHGPCCHCLATESPQWRKGPKCKPILCNACGTRFLRTRSLGKSMGKGVSKKLSFSSASSCNLDDMMPAEFGHGLKEDNTREAAAGASPAFFQASPVSQTQLQQPLGDASC